MPHVSDLLTLLLQHRLWWIQVDLPALNEFNWTKKAYNTRRPQPKKEKKTWVTQAVPGTGFLSHKWPNTSTRHASGWIPITNGTASMRKRKLIEKRNAEWEQSARWAMRAAALIDKRNIWSNWRQKLPFRGDRANIAPNMTGTYARNPVPHAWIGADRVALIICRCS